jgi:hypothetical protein
VLEALELVSIISFLVSLDMCLPDLFLALVCYHNINNEIKVIRMNLEYDIAS